VYLLASFARGTLYIGVTNGLLFHVSQNRSGKGGASTRRYKVHQLVWYELHENIEDAIQREKSLKFYPRAWKINLIERDNLHWTDLYPALEARHGIPTIPPG
jgi:putative endonuclease